MAPLATREADSLCTHSVFGQPWWLDAVAPGAWDEVHLSVGGRIVARLPFAVRRAFGRTVLTQPPLTQTLGPWLAPGEGKYATRLGADQEAMRALIARLPACDLFLQNFSPLVTDWLPFRWAGFSATPRYTYRLEDLTDLDRVWAGFLEHVRREIRKAARQLAVRTDLPPHDMSPLLRMTFRRRGLTVPYEESLLERLHRVCTERGAGRLFVAEDARGRAHAGVFVVWDTRTAYYLVGARHDDHATSGAISLLLWEAIRFAAGVTRVFDFEGSVIEPVERFFRGFGGHQTPYLQVWRVRGPLRPLVRLGLVRGLPDSVFGRRRSR